LAEFEADALIISSGSFVDELASVKTRVSKPGVPVARPNHAIVPALNDFGAMSIVKYEEVPSLRAPIPDLVATRGTEPTAVIMRPLTISIPVRPSTATKRPRVKGLLRASLAWSWGWERRWRKSGRSIGLAYQ
jgi:hypothetical protein